LFAASKTISEGQFSNIPIIDDRTGATTDEFYASIDGRPYHSLYTSGSLSQDVLVISAKAAVQAERINFRLPSNISVGTYELGIPYETEYSAQYFSLFGNGFFPSYTGSLTITEHDTASSFIKGSFSFETDKYDESGTLQINDGSFQVNY